MTPCCSKPLELFYQEISSLNFVPNSKNLLEDFFTVTICGCYVALALITNLQSYHLHVHFVDFQYEGDKIELRL